MKFGLFFTLDHYEDPYLTPEQHLQEVAEQVQAAEDMGYQTVWFTEQHFNAMDGLCADPITLMSYMASKTSTIRIGSAVTLAALYNPVHLAEAYALVDVLSGGRIDIGIGASSMKRAFQVYGVPFESRRQLRDKAVDEMLSLWGYRGFSLSQPGEKIGPAEVRLNLNPLQKPHPPIWVSTGTLDRAQAILACGHSLLFDYLFCDFDASNTTSIKANLGRYAELSPGKVAAVFYTQLEAVDSSYNRLHRYYNDFLRSIRGPGFKMECAWNDLQDKGHILCCPVPEAQRRVERVANQGLDQLMLGIGFGGVSHKSVMSTLETFASEIMPNFT
jgi:hypothetical protein